MKSTIVKPYAVKRKIKMLEDFCIFDKDGSIFSYLSKSISEIELERKATKIAKDFLDQREETANEYYLRMRLPI